MKNQNISERLNYAKTSLIGLSVGDAFGEKDEPSPFDAYEGSAQIGEFIKTISEDREISIICGHRHKKLFLDMGNIKLYRSPVGYLDKSQKDYESIAREVIDDFEM